MHYIQAAERFPIDGRDNDAQVSPLLMHTSPPLVYMSRSKVLVAKERYRVVIPTDIYVKRMTGRINTEQ
jgi:hypothetical protein